MEQTYVEADNAKLISALLESGLEIQHVVAQLKTLKPRKIPSQFSVRLATVADVPKLIELELEFERHMRSKPISAEFDSESIEEMAEGFQEQLAMEDFVTLVALEEDLVVGMSYGCSAERSMLHSGNRRPEQSATLAKVVVSEAFRKQGLGSALATETIYALTRMGFNTIVSDWRLKNVSAGNTWSKLGFEPTWFRLVPVAK